MITHLNLILPLVYEQYWKARRRLAEPFDKHENWRKQAKLLKLSKEACTRLEWIIFYETKAEKNASLTCRHFALPPKTFYKWKNRFDGKNLRTLEDQSRAPRHTRQRTITPEEESRVVTLRREHMVWGKMKLTELYKVSITNPSLPGSSSTP